MSLVNARNIVQTLHHADMSKQKHALDIIILFYVYFSAFALPVGRFCDTTFVHATEYTSDWISTPISKTCPNSVGKI